VDKSISTSSFKPLLDQLEALLAEEREELRKPTADALVQLADRKLRLDAELARVAETDKPSADERNQLARIQRAARINQLLLVHARSCVQGALQLLTGEAFKNPTLRQTATTQKPVAVNIRG
jgi:hypothetical protein